MVTPRYLAEVTLDSEWPCSLHSVWIGFLLPVTFRTLHLVAWNFIFHFLLNVFGVGVSCRNLYSFVVYLYVNGSGSITSVGEERANLSAVVYL